MPLPNKRKAAGSGNDVRSAPPQHVAAQALDEAEDLQQRAERKRRATPEAVNAFLLAASKFEGALSLEQQQPMPFDRHMDACFGLAETLQMGGEAVVAAAAGMQDDQLSQTVQDQAAAQARDLFRRGVQAYEQVKTGTGEMRADAAVDRGNTLASWAELAAPAEAAKLLASAVASYSEALRQEEDAVTLNNLADAMVAAAEAHSDLGQHEQAATLYQKAMQAYNRACSLSSSENGDDLPGLLHNWGSGLHSAGSHVQTPRADGA
eukprot:jgi/Astpho2/3858/Aster-x0600